MSIKRLSAVPCRSWMGCMAIGLAVAIGAVPASFAQNSQATDHGRSAGTGIAAENRQPHHGSCDELKSEGPAPAGVVVAVPVGKVSIGPEFVGGDPIFVRRTTAENGVTIVEVSATPFMSDLGTQDVLQTSSALARRAAELPAPW